MTPSARRSQQLVTRVFRRLFSGLTPQRGPAERATTGFSLYSTTDSDSDSAVESCAEVEDREETGADPRIHQPQVLRAYLRHRRGRCVSRVREQGLVPAVLVDGDKECRPKDGSSDVFISLDAKPLVALLKLIGKRDFVSRVFHMDIYRSATASELQERLQVLPRNLNYGSGKTNILNVQFIRAPLGQNLKLGVPLEFLGTHLCPGLKKGGTLNMLAKYVLYNCQANEVPAKIVVDMSVLEIGDRVRVQDLEVDFNHLASDKTMVVCEIVKDVKTLKAKARRLKNELLYKKKALAQKESSLHSHSLSDDEVDASDDGEDEVIPYRYQKQRALAKERASSKMVISKSLSAEAEADTSSNARARFDSAGIKARISQSRETRSSSKRRLVGTSSVLSRENSDERKIGCKVSSSLKKQKVVEAIDFKAHGISPKKSRQKR